MALAPMPKVVLGSIAFAIFWVLAVFPAVPFLPIGRTAGSLLGAMLMVIFGVLTPKQAYAAIDLPILGLLFGTMVVSVYLERADMFKYLGKFLSWKSKGAKDLLCRICLISAVSSALFTNDTACVVLTEFILKIARQHNLPPHPFLLALASSANIGSSATPIGNPQNLVIAFQSQISFGQFLTGVCPAMLVGVVVNALILVTMYWRLLSTHKDEEDSFLEVVAEEEDNSQEMIPLLTNRSTPSESEIQMVPSSTLDSTRNSNASKEGTNDMPSQTREETSPSKAVAAVDKPREAHFMHSSEGKDYLTVYWRLLSTHKDEEDPFLEVVTEEEDNSQEMIPLLTNRSTPSEIEIQMVPSSTLDSTRNSNASKEGTNDMPSQTREETSPSKAVAAVDKPREAHLMHSSEGKDYLNTKWKGILWKSCVYTITFGMLIAMLLGLNMSWTAITAALALVVLDFKDAGPCLEKVSYSILVFFCGMFITVDGFNKTGIPSALWDLMEPYSQVDRASGIAILALVILVISNLASNVPTVLLLGAQVAASAAAISKEDEKKAWLILAWVSTVAGNLSLLGSAANLIVCEQARQAPKLAYTLTFWSHLKFGLPSTLIVTAIGLTLIR